MASPLEPQHGGEGRRPLVLAAAEAVAVGEEEGVRAVVAQLGAQQELDEARLTTESGVAGQSQADDALGDAGGEALGVAVGLGAESGGEALADVFPQIEGDAS